MRKIGLSYTESMKRGCDCMERLFYGETTVKKLREALAEYDDNDIVEIISSGGEWSTAELNVVNSRGQTVGALMEVDG